MTERKFQIFFQQVLAVFMDIGRAIDGDTIE